MNTTQYTVTVRGKHEVWRFELSYHEADVVLVLNVHKDASQSSDIQCTVNNPCVSQLGSPASHAATFIDMWTIKLLTEVDMTCAHTSEI